MAFSTHEHGGVEELRWNAAPTWWRVVGKCEQMLLVLLAGSTTTEGKISSDLLVLLGAQSAPNLAAQNTETL